MFTEHQYEPRVSPTCLIRGDIDHHRLGKLIAQVCNSVQRYDTKGVVGVRCEVQHRHPRFRQPRLLGDKAHRQHTRPGHQYPVHGSTTSNRSSSGCVGLSRSPVDVAHPVDSRGGPLAALTPRSLFLTLEAHHVVDDVSAASRVQRRTPLQTDGGAVHR